MSLRIAKYKGLSLSLPHSQQPIKKKVFSDFDENAIMRK
jgi:hypothetical protein